jgi:hypothetical protein
MLSSFLAATAATASASSVAPAASTETSALPALAQVSIAPSRTAALAAAPRAASMKTPTYRRKAPAPRVRRTVRNTRTGSGYGYVAGARQATSLRRIATRSTTRTTRTTTAKTSTSGELARARSILAGYVARYPICKGATLYFGKTPAGSEGAVYLGSGTIVINPNHTSSLSYIIGHEIQHLRQYRESR